MYQQLQQRLSLISSSDCESALSSSKIGLEKESLRVLPEGGISQTPFPEAWGSALTNPQITTDFSEALAELVTPPCDSIGEVVQSLDDIQNFVYRNLDNEILWATSMPCVVAGETDIPLALYGSSNAAQMKTIYRRGLGLRYGRAMQVIAGVHFNYSFSDGFWQRYKQLLNNDDSYQDFVSEQYMGVVRNLLRYGWLVPYLFGASPSVCKSFLNGKPTLLQEFNSNTYYEPYATSLRLGNIGYQNNKEDLAGIKACYDSLDEYIESMLCAISTPYPGYEEIGVKVKSPEGEDEYLQLNTNILQIENEYYSSVRPKQILQGNEKPSTALKKRGVQYVELRSLDVNAFDPHGINSEQLYFLEVFMLFCLLHKSPSLSSDEMAAIDENLLLVAHKGREPGLELRRLDDTCKEETITLQDWATELCKQMKPVAGLLDSANYCENYFSSVKSQIASVFDPDLTPSARMLEKMRERDEGFFHFAQRMSKHHYQYYKNHELSEEKRTFFEEMARSSLVKQKELEAQDDVSFDEYLQNYFNEV